MKVGGKLQRAENSQHNQNFERLTRMLIPALWRTAYRMTGCRDIADDLTQDACTKAYKSFEQYKKGTNYKAWLFKILTNLCRDRIRRESLTPFNVWDEQEVDKAIAFNRCEPEPERECQNAEFYTDALEAISRLPPQIKLVVCFSLLDGLSYREIAEIADIPVGTVRSRLSRGRRQLQYELKSHHSKTYLKATVRYLVPERLVEKNNEDDESVSSRAEFLT